MAPALLPDNRRTQRILASREGRPAFWLLRGTERIALHDLSLEGFALPETLGYRHGMRMPFIIAFDGVAEQVRGEAEVANVIGGTDGRTGFRIHAMDAADRRRLHEWLAGHVLACAAVPISGEDAAALVAGPSIV